MADQDFNITIRTIADTTGIKLTQQQLEALQTAANQGNTRAISALKQLTDAAKQAASAASGLSLAGGLIGGLAGGAVTGLISAAISQFKALNDEQDRMIENMIKATERSRSLGLEIVQTLDDMIEKERVATEPLEQSFDRLTQKTRSLKAEMKIAFETEAYEDFKKLNQQLQFTESLLNQVTSDIDKQTAANERNAKAAEKAARQKQQQEDSFIKGAIEASSAQTKAVIANEKAAADARAAGREREADLYQKNAEQLEKSMTQAQREELESLRKGTATPIGRKAGIGESQEKVDQIERNRINDERMKAGLRPLGEDAEKDHELLARIFDSLASLNNRFDRYWS